MPPGLLRRIWSCSSLSMSRFSGWIRTPEIPQISTIVPVVSCPGVEGSLLRPQDYRIATVVSVRDGAVSNTSRHFS